MAFAKTIDEAYRDYLDEESKTEEDEIGEEIVEYLNKYLYLGLSGDNPTKAIYRGEGVITFAGYRVEVGGYDHSPYVEEQEIPGKDKQSDVGDAAEIVKQFASDDEVNKVQKTSSGAINKMERKIRDIGSKL